ncbi:hypothetical protein SLH49_11410 [Cognatiyoonia sp. IB215446]|uniref:carboxymuconolactone decarboxylase family protein n=1 Tax=Cognatiyoonia sp. IB215446 TaxID=3097355 RepID=UPI002A0C156A|nr:hypothetical protein [Cognatiyoonia sp. IB215446]MDX8348594.1 hypothetical protein [Cognatiyoonia sp. IB215446]
MPKLIAKLLASACLSISTANAQDIPAADEAMPYYDRHLIDISNLRYFTEGSMIGDMMIHANAMFDAESKWKMTLYQMIQAGSGHHQARSAFQLSHLGVPMEDILAVWQPNYIETIEDQRLKAAFTFVDQLSQLPGDVTANSHAMLRRHFVDRQIAELIEMIAFNAANAAHDNILPIPTDQATVSWANANLYSVGWTVGKNVSASAEEQRAALFAGELMENARQEILKNWKREDLSAPPAEFDSDWLNAVTGYNVSRVTMDSDQDGVEDPFDYYPIDHDRWAQPGIADLNLPDEKTPAFDVSAYDFTYYRPPMSTDTEVAFSDRINFDTQWMRQSGMGTSRIEDYFAAGDRALPMKFLWQVFVTFQLSSGCTHCQVHGTRWLYEFLQDEAPDGIVDEAALSSIYDLFDIERSQQFSPAEMAALRFARDAGPLPARTTAAHIEELRRHYSNREIQELMMVIISGARLSAGQQGNVTVTDRTSMAWALRALPKVGWRPGDHLGLPQEQRRLFMSEIEPTVMAILMSGDSLDFASEWIGKPVPIAVDADGDGVKDAFDGFPNDPTRWEDTDRDGIEDIADADIDGDGLSNEFEAQTMTFPYKADSDGDGVIDPEELRVGTDPLDPSSLQLGRHFQMICKDLNLQMASAETVPTISIPLDQIGAITVDAADNKGMGVLLHHLHEQTVRRRHSY